MITVGSISREDASSSFPFLAEHFPGRRSAIRKLTHANPEFVFWIFPDGRLYDARDSHLRNIPKGFEHIVHDEPHYGGFLRGRVVRHIGHQLFVAYCHENALAAPSAKIPQFLKGVAALPIPVEQDALVISDNADIYGTLADIRASAR